MSNASAVGAKAREGQTFSGESTFARWMSFVKLPHTVFALPFALVGVTLASKLAPISLGMLGWVVLAFTSARWVAMAVNRIVDREFDAQNPRTAQREIPRGAIRVRDAWLTVVVAAALFVWAAAQLNPLCLYLSPVALAWVCFYSFTKRFTRYAHLVLGLGLAIAPVGGFLAVTGLWSEPWWMLIALTVAVMTWSGGFDVLYALPDVEFDRSQGLHSIPAAVGVPRAVAIARLLHVTTVLALAATVWVTGGGWFAWAGVATAAVLLGYEHSLVKSDDLSKLDAAFFTMNGVISMTFFAWMLLDRIFG
ncbi:MAG: putative 4-hydroxybenzoate polyprenyltransferase [Gemmatimonadaceae bacterium]|nr:putative 4-hydroxybenzoate polyprenyltransferase [Gemmatimonadaceae bacterium]